MFDVIRIPAFKDNYIWLLRKGASAAVVDPGDARPVLDLLEREGLSLTSILVTHHHADHQGGVAGTAGALSGRGLRSGGGVDYRHQQAVIAAARRCALRPVTSSFR
jgi:glyoxylase-like metal-dependent hydrolase (beta-lactamase superfamily II)